jgi:hypothetical protein
MCRFNLRSLLVAGVFVLGACGCDSKDLVDATAEINKASEHLEKGMGKLGQGVDPLAVKQLLNKVFELQAQNEKYKDILRSGSAAIDLRTKKVWLFVKQYRGRIDPSIYIDHDPTNVAWSMSLSSGNWEGRPDDQRYGSEITGKFGSPGYHVVDIAVNATPQKGEQPWGLDVHIYTTDTSVMTAPQAVANGTLISHVELGEANKANLVDPKGIAHIGLWLQVE